MPMPLCWFERDGDTVPADEDDHRPEQDEHRALAVHPPRPAPHQVAAPVLVPHGYPPHDGHDHGRPGHGKDQVEARQLVEDAVAVRREESGQRHRQDDAGPVGQHTRDRQGPGLQKAGPEGLDAGPGLRVEQQLGSEVGADGVGGQRHGGRH